MNSSTGSCPVWGTNDFQWVSAFWIWSTCFGTGSVIPSVSLQNPGVDATTLIQPWIIEPWNPYRAGEIKKKKFIKLICKVDGKTYEEEKEVEDKNSNVLVEDVDVVIETTSNIDVKKLEE